MKKIEKKVRLGWRLKIEKMEKKVRLGWRLKNGKMEKKLGKVRGRK